MFKLFRKMNKAIMISIVVVFAGTMFYGLGYMGMKTLEGAGKPGKGLATVNGQDVDAFRYNQIISRLVAQSKGALDPMSMLYVQSMALSQLIDFTIFAQEARKNFGASGDEINAALADLMKSNNIPDLPTFEKILKSQGFSLDALKNMLRDEYATQKMANKIQGEVKVAPKDLLEVRASHILIASGKNDPGNKQKAAKEKAEKILAEARSGKDFAVLAKQYSDDGGTAKKGGDLGYFRTGMMVKEFEDAVFSLRPGQISDLIKTDFGYHIIKVEDSRVRAGITNDKALQEKRANEFGAWLNGLKAKAKIVIKNDLLNAFDKRIKGDYPGALAQYKKAVENDPQNAYAHLFYADILNQMGDPSSAAQQYNMASTLAGSDPYAHIYIGRAYQAAAKASKSATSEGFSYSARQEFSKASILAGENMQVRENLAKFYKEMGMSDMLKEENAKIAQLKERQKFEEEIKKEAAKKK